MHRLSFFGPIYALINLFIYILQHSDTPGIQSDLALMEVGVGFFAKVKFTTDSEVSISFVREMAALAQQATETAFRHRTGSTSMDYDRDLFPHMPQISETLGSEGRVAEDQVSTDQTLVRSSFSRFMLIHQLL